MSFFLPIIAIILLISVFAYKRISDNKRYQDTVYLQYLERITLFLNMINSLDEYLTWVERDKIKVEFSDIGIFFKNRDIYYKKEDRVRQFNEIFQDLNFFTINYNKKFVINQKEKYRRFFDDIEGKSLDDQQRTALITDEYSNLIIAGAGSGKTLTILGKIKYLTELRNINPKDILLLSFTKKTVEELNVRLKAMGIFTQAITFHKLGYDTIKKYENNSPAVTNETTLSRVIKKYLRSTIFDNPDALNAYIQYVACYMNIPEEHDKYGSLGEKIDSEKGIDFETLKSKVEDLNIVKKSTLDTLQGERVKSIEELIIANFLYLNGIEYEYEKPYPHGEIMYRPDFYLKDYDIYLEHFGVDENDRAKWLTPFNEKKYVEEMRIKRETHETYNTRLLETFSYYNRDNVLLTRLREMLEAESITFKPRDPKYIYSKVFDNDSNFGNEIIRLIESFINLSKSRRLDSTALIELFSNKSFYNRDFITERHAIFLKFVLPILKEYNNLLTERQEIDFNDMINHAFDLIKENQPEYSYRYIIIDEYQDISFSRFNLIKEIRSLSGARLVCVGDDWQSIYRFAGSDISLFTNFKKYVGEYEQLLIEKTYRNSQILINISSKFIQKNPKQISKFPTSKRELIGEPIKFVYYKDESLISTFLSTVNQLIEKYESKSILVLGRHSFDINDLIKMSGGNRIRYHETSGKIAIQGLEEIDIYFMTVHKSKGMEADNVIILNLRNHLLGFPNKMTDDPILSVLLSDEENYRFAEERRLFYVALTRTKNEVVLLVPSNSSQFVTELQSDDYLFSTTADGINKTHCPYCQTGNLIIRQNSKDGSNFLGCSNYPLCNQTYSRLEILEDKYLCPRCESGFMIKKTGRYGNFLGCTNYPDCKNTINLK